MASSISRNSIMTVLGVIAPMAVTVFTLPIYLRLIGEERYGILALIWLVFGYFGLFDFGLSRATANHLARLRQAPAEEKAPAVKQEEQPAAAPEAPADVPPEDLQPQGSEPVPEQQPERGQ